MGIDPVELADRTHPKVRNIEFPDKATYDRILNDMVIAFLHSRVGCETEESTDKYCRNVLATCKSGFRTNGDIWKNAPGKPSDDWYEVLRKRLRIYRYDIDNRRLIPGNTKKTSIKLQEKFGLKKPDKKDLSTAFDATDSPISKQSLSASEKVQMEDFKEAFLKDFPIKKSVVDILMMNRLAFMYIMNKRDYDNIEITRFLTDEIIKLSESLGVSGKQRVSQDDKDRSGTIDELVSIYKKTKEEYIDIDVEYMREELLLISNAIHRGTLEEFLGMSYVKRLFGYTIDGENISLKTIDKWLVKNGVEVIVDEA